jgi:hypothetical protein
MLPALDGLTPQGFWENLHVAFFYAAVALGYIVTYSALENDSPTLTVVAYAADAGERGLSREDVASLLNKDFISGSRFQSLVGSRLVEQVGGAFVLTARGRAWARLFRLFRTVYRLPKGG